MRGCVKRSAKHTQHANARNFEAVALALLHVHPASALRREREPTFVWDNDCCQQLVRPRRRDCQQIAMELPFLADALEWTTSILYPKPGKALRYNDIAIMSPTEHTWTIAKSTGNACLEPDLELTRLDHLRHARQF